MLAGPEKVVTSTAMFRPGPRRRAYDSSAARQSIVRNQELYPYGTFPGYPVSIRLRDHAFSC
jgi:hypothetical protein